MTGSEVVLKTKELSKSFGDLQAVDKLNVEFEKNKTIGLIGPNGAGKTVFFNLITGHEKPDSGEVTYKDKVMTGLEPYLLTQKGIARTFQEVRSMPSLTTIETLYVPLLNMKKDKLGISEDLSEDKIAMEILNLFGLEDKAFENTDTLSHAELKSLEVARAVATFPDLLLLDEPLAGLNPNEKEFLLESIMSIEQDFLSKFNTNNLTLVIIEHNLSELMGVVDKVTVLSEGKKIAEDSPEKIVEDKTVKEAYFGEEF